MNALLDGGRIEDPIGATLAREVTRVRCLTLGISWAALDSMDDQQMDRVTLIGELITARRIGNLGG